MRPEAFLWRRDIEAHDNCMLGTARTNGTPGANAYEKAYAGDIHPVCPSQVSTSCLVLSKEGKRWHLTVRVEDGECYPLPPAQTSHCQGTLPPPPNDTSHLTCSHRTRLNKGSNDGPSRTQLSFFSPRQVLRSRPHPSSHRDRRCRTGCGRGRGIRGRAFRKMLRDGRCVTARSASSIPRCARHRACRACSQRHGARRGNSLSPPDQCWRGKSCR